jgi:hypothetical protein
MKYVKPQVTTDKYKKQLLLYVSVSSLKKYAKVLSGTAYEMSEAKSVLKAMQ